MSYATTPQSMKPFNRDEKPLVLIVDDEPTNLHVLKRILEQDYRLAFATNGKKAIQLVHAEPPELILLDIMMPEMSGLEVCAELKSEKLLAHIPIIFVTALSDGANETDGLDAGAVDYITKPVNPSVVKARVRVHLNTNRLDAIHQSRLELVQTLGRAAEYKDNETGQHVIRMSHYSKIMAKAIGFSERAAEELLHAAPMHDVGKIGIPDAILLKPGKLTDEEWAVMRQHASMGAEIIGQHSSSLLKLARVIALTHHEKWDGSGYPNGLKGAEIPIEGRIVAIADVFDALTSERPYKRAWTVEEAVNLMKEQSGKHFDPDLVTVFEDCLSEILLVKAKWQDEIIE
ncbi:HD domain-containing phosphohydrolase [Marinomonas dokdonensis]|uniref:HD domain-containing phosphohydrolase n=1 Tax=Marinomonas dokdonensis TaxID=328224 RepID=UPI00405547B4